jgi:hypothetical protein
LVTDADNYGNDYTRTRTMMLDYGWPDDFRRSDFKRDYTQALCDTWRTEKDHEEDDILARNPGMSRREAEHQQDEAIRERARARDAERAMERLRLTDGKEDEMIGVESDEPSRYTHTDAQHNTMTLVFRPA